MDDLCAVRGGGVRLALIVNPSASPFAMGKGARQAAILQKHAAKRGVAVAAVNQFGANDELIFDGGAAVYAAGGKLVVCNEPLRGEMVLVDVDWAGGADGAGGVVRVGLAEGLSTRRSGESGGSGEEEDERRENGGKREVYREEGEERIGEGSEGSRVLGFEGQEKMSQEKRGEEKRGREERGLEKRGDEELLYRALVLGVKDYCRKTGFGAAVLGLSGGIDSAVCAVLACAALGPGKVMGASMPSRFSSQGSKDDAFDLARRLGMTCYSLPIEEGFVALQALLGPTFAVLGKSAPDVTEENLQSRLRGTVLMGLSNKLNCLLLTTGNKSEMAVGYCTLYGDMNGGLAVLSDVTKQWVYRLANWMNAHPALLEIAGLEGPPIPLATITKPPSAELRENQTDQDSLPPYEVLDEIIERYVEGRQARGQIASEMIAGGFGGRVERGLVDKICRMIDLAEFKRKQAAIGLKVTPVAFGSGRRMPIAQGWRG